MIFLLFRIVIVVLILLGLFAVIKMFLKPADFVRCSRCDGKGFWLGARGREKCDWCKGTGRLPNQG